MGVRGTGESGGLMERSGILLGTELGEFWGVKRKSWGGGFPGNWSSSGGTNTYVQGSWFFVDSNSKEIQGPGEGEGEGN